MKRFTVKEEALKELELQQNKMPRWFCPLTKESCRTDCICFSRAFMRDFNTTFSVYPSTCANYMFFGNN